MSKTSKTSLENTISNIAIPIVKMARLGLGMSGKKLAASKMYPFLQLLFAGQHIVQAQRKILASQESTKI